jgi:hypothetical protein
LKIAGSTFNEEEGEEIEAIVKVSLIAKRMKDLPNKSKIKKKIKNSTAEIFSDAIEEINYTTLITSKCKVRGLN